MLDLEKAAQLMGKFEDVTHQSLEDWSAYDELKDKSLEEEPRALLQCIEKCVIGELQNQFKTEMINRLSALYLKELVNLLIEVRSLLI